MVEKLSGNERKSEYLLDCSRLAIRVHLYRGGKRKRHRFQIGSQRIQFNVLIEQ